MTNEGETAAATFATASSHKQHSGKDGETVILDNEPMGLVFKPTTGRKETRGGAKITGLKNAANPAYLGNCSPAASRVSDRVADTVGMVVEAVGDIEVHAVPFAEVMKTLKTAGFACVRLTLCNPNPNMEPKGGLRQ
jgi:hypothetical protein